jgi:hypothetical protein
MRKVLGQPEINLLWISLWKVNWRFRAIPRCLCTSGQYFRRWLPEADDAASIATTPSPVRICGRSARRQLTLE